VFAVGAVYHHRLRAEPAAVFGQARAYGRSHAQLWARHGDRRRAPGDDLRQAGREWWWLVTRAPLAVTGRHRLRWLRRAGRRLGRLEGSVRNCVIVL